MTYDYELIENALNISDYQDLDKFSLYSGNRWHFNNSTSGTLEKPVSFNTDLDLTKFSYKEIFQFVYPIVWNSEYIDSNGFKYLSPLLNRISLVFNKFLIKRIKLNLITPGCNSDKIFYSTPHIDEKEFNKNSYTAIFYFDDSLGGTILFNEKIDNKSIIDNSSLSSIIPNTLTVKQIFNSKKNSLLIFRSNMFHSGCYFSDVEYRRIININFEVVNE